MRRADKTENMVNAYLCVGIEYNGKVDAARPVEM